LASKKISELTAVTGVTNDDLMIVVDMAGPTTNKITVKDFVNSIPSNTSFAANVSVSGVLTGNVVTVTGNATFDSANYLVGNNVIVKKTTVPSSSTDTVTAADVGKIWVVDGFLYYQANATHYRRVAGSTF
jgi:hypothetical protein